MSLLGMRFCRVAAGDDAQKLASALGEGGLGLDLRKLDLPEDFGGFPGAIFPLSEGGDKSWVEIWQANEHMPEGTMLQLIVDDADAYAEQARRNGLQAEGPMDAHGERIYFVNGLPGLMMSFQSKLPDA